MKATTLCLFLLSLLSAAPLASAPHEPSAREIVRKMDELYRASSCVALMEMEIITPHWSRTLKLRSWSEGQDRFFIRILEPRKEAGVTTLRLGTEMWNYLPKTDKTIRVPPSMMMGSWMGSDFTNDDLVKEFTLLDDYTYAFTTQPDTPPDTLLIRCTPREDLPVVWGHILLAVDAKTHLPHYQNYYDEKGKLMREMIFRELTTFGNRRIPAVMELIPTNKPRQKTIVRYLEAAFDTPIPKDTFSLRNLRAEH